ncbi:MAG: SAM-dependent methyltransferase [Alphaproteobacteria bacterium]|nr:SAM-dependent methyltransferase [Alphaproteobacteria bacterium]
MLSSIEDVLRNKIKKGGAIDLAEFINIALYHPEFGYYMTRDPFGVDGDFITAPEVSQMFGEMLGVWLADIWMQMGKPKRIVLLECGPGRGTLMADILRATGNIVGFHEALHIKMLECSPVLMSKQKKALSFFKKVEWIDSLKMLEDKYPILVIGNEFLDAFPVQHYRRKNGKTQKRVVVMDGDDFITDWHDTEYECPAGVIMEVSLAQENFIDACLKLLKKASGACLFIDYGYFNVKFGETLQILNKHKKVGLFDYIGQSDITAHVNFGELKERVQNSGAIWHGGVTQSDFLTSLGIELRAEALKKTALKNLPIKDAQQKIIEIDRDLNRLIDTKEMGELFKAVCFSFGLSINPAGFLK